MNLKDHIRSIPDYPKKGILFRDITTLIKNEKAFAETINQIVERSKKYKVTTDSNHSFNIAPNLLNRDFHADQPNQKWAGDISYVWTREGWLYLAVILDLHSRRVIGWAVSNRMKHDLAIRALKMAVALRQPPKGCIHHTDRGSQYCSHDYQKVLRQHRFRVSMSGKGNCYDCEYGIAA